MVRKSTPDGGDGGNSPEYHLRLFVAGDEPNSAIAKASVNRICSEHLGPRCRVEIIDVLEDVQAAREEKVLVTPALVIRGPQHRTVVCGNLAEVKKVLAALQGDNERA